MTMCYNCHMDDRDLYWLAGLFEGEGTFCFAYGKPRALAIQMTDLDTLKRVQDLVGGNICKTKKQKDHHKESWRWYMSGLKAKNLAVKLEPLLMSRRAARCREFIEKSSNRTEDTLSKRNKAISLREQGLTTTQIGAILNIDRSYVSHLLGKRGAAMVAEPNVG